MSLPTRLNRVNLSNDGTNWGFVESAATSHDLELNAASGSNIVAKNPLYYLNSSDTSTSLNTTLDGFSTSIAGKQDTIGDDDLSISHVSGLADELNEKLTLDDVVADITDGSEEPVRAGAVFTALASKQDSLTFDAVPVNLSTNPVESGGVYSALSLKQDSLTFDSAPVDSSSNPVESGGVFTALAGKADTSVTDAIIARLDAIDALFGNINNPNPSA
jgi:hypothetical protein